MPTDAYRSVTEYRAAAHRTRGKHLSKGKRQSQPKRPTCLCLGGCQPKRRVSPAVAELLVPLRRSWKAVTGQDLAPGKFRCPLCLREVQEFCATLAHAPSAAVGGKVVGLQCKQCNDYVGHYYEAIAKRDAVRATGDRVIRVGATGKGARVKVRATFDEDPEDPRHHHIHLSPAGTQSDYDRALSHLSKQGGIGGLALGPMSPRGPVGALLTWSYLLWFERFGYAFALSRSLQRLRRAILRGDVDDLGRSPVFRLGPPPARWDQGEPAAVTVEAGGRGLRMLGWRWRSFVVVLPLPEDASGMVYDALDDLVEDHDSLDVTPSVLTFERNTRFGLPIPDDPTSEPILSVDYHKVRLVGGPKAESLLSASEPVTPVWSRHSGKEDLPRPMPAALPSVVSPQEWPTVAVAEARRVCINKDSITPEVERAIAAYASEASEADRALAYLRSVLDEGTVEHLRDLRRFALHGEAYDSGVDGGSVDSVMWTVDHAIRGVPKTARPRPAEITVTHPSGERLATAVAFLENAAASEVEVVGPFYTSRAMLASIKARMKRLRAEARAAQQSQATNAR